MVNPVTKLQEVAFATLEGGVGNIVTVQFPQAAEVERFVLEPSVVIVRLPRAAVETVAPLPAGAPAPTPPGDVLAATRVSSFHQLGYRGRGTRIVVIATDFPDLGLMAGVHFLDKTLKTPVEVIDLTAELTPDLRPVPPGTNLSWAGTAAARSAHLSAPDARLVLVRVDQAAYFHVYTVARFVAGDALYTEAMQSRLAELSIRTEDLRRKYAEAVDEYRRANQNLSDEEGPAERRRQAAKRLELLIQEDADNAATIERALSLQRSMRALSASTVVVNTLAWETGFAHDGMSELSRTIDVSFAGEAITSPRTRSATRPQSTQRPLWVQASSPSAGSIWAGAFLDVDGNGVMEFAGPESRIPAEEWIRELNFLATRGPDGAVSRTLTAGTKVRLTVQWRETHDPTSYGGRESIFPLTLRVLQQLDPAGKGRASDEMKEVARSVGGPYRVIAEPTYGVYEQIVEFAVPADGRYCVSIEGQTVFDPRLPALRRQIEITPRMFAEFIGTTPEAGRPVFASFAPSSAGVAIPGDAKAAVTVGETDKPLGTTTNGLTGAGPGLQLLTKPDVLAYGTLDLGGTTVGGSSVSAGFVGGILAGLVGSGAPSADIIRATGMQPGGPAAIPEGWLRVVPPRPTPR